MSLTFQVSLFCLQLFTKAFHLSKLIWNSSDQLRPTLQRWRTILRHDVLLFVLIVFFFLGGLNNAFFTRITLRSVCYGSELFCLQNTGCQETLYVQCCQSFPERSGEMFLEDYNINSQTLFAMKIICFLCVHRVVL